MADPILSEDEDLDFPPEPDMDDVPPPADPVELPPPLSEAMPLPAPPEGGTGGAEGGGGDGGGGALIVAPGPELAGLPWLETGSEGTIPAWGAPGDDVVGSPAPDFGADTIWETESRGNDGLFEPAPELCVFELFVDHGMDVLL